MNDSPSTADALSEALAGCGGSEALEAFAEFLRQRADSDSELSSSFPYDRAAEMVEEISSRLFQEAESSSR